MHKLIRATTPTHYFTFPEIAFARILITYAQEGEIILEKNESDLTWNGNVASVTLTQEETNLFQAGVDAKRQVRTLTEEGDALVSYEDVIKVAGVLNDIVLEVDDG